MIQLGIHCQVLPHIDYNKYDFVKLLEGTVDLIKSAYNVAFNQLLQ
ncbi:MAG: hypothetical protein JWQ84_3635 [Mucilaginibacter sp.]|nr:hypothetical protein [Mucilaginibacter sp.]MDB5138815.1 hypothetical protein [Mucilaginibacter sp.]